MKTNSIAPSVSFALLMLPAWALADEAKPRCIEGDTDQLSYQIETPKIDLAGVDAADGLKVIDAKTHHLGVAGRPEWDEFAIDRPESDRLELHFDAQANTREATLFIRQRDVKLSWDVKMNGRSLGQLALSESSLLHTMAAPAGTLRDGENVLSVLPPAAADDIVISEVLLDMRTRPAALNRSTVEVRVNDADTGTGLPCRVTVVDQYGSLAPLWNSPDERLVVRTGVVYTRDGRATLGLPPGKYTLYATRGFEYGLAQKTLSVAEGGTERVSLTIRREVPTPGLVSCDTHVHTLTFSGHGDATIDERALTLAGESIELPIATDHNHFTDLTPAAERMGVRGFFTPVVGDEVTTNVGHFNAFPFETSSPVPDFGLADWPTLMRSMRAEPGERVIILNHPRDLHSNFRPFDPANYNAVTGEHRRWPDLGFDAIEVVNSGAQQSDPIQPFRDWFALLNHGHRITAVGSSDSHDVSRFIVGQGRTYVACPDADPAHLDVSVAVKSLRAGRGFVSLGLLTQLTIDGRFRVGDLATGLGDELNVEVTVLGPTWVGADHLELYANGVMIREQSFDTSSTSVEKAKLHWSIPRPRQDVHLVAIASGPGVRGPFWPLARPYQPTTLSSRTRVIGATNPIWIDGDGNGSYSSPREIAAGLLKHTGTDPEALLAVLGNYDEAVSVQAASLCQAKGRDVRDSDFARRLKTAPEQVRRGFAAFAASIAIP